MSIKAISWAFKQRCKTPAEKLVLISLADQANDAGECWPGQSYIAEKCDISRESVCRLLRSLERQGLIASARGKDASGRDTGKRYFLKNLHPGMENLHPGVINNHMQCDKKSHGMCVNVTPHIRCRTVIEPSLNQEHDAREKFEPLPANPTPSEEPEQSHLSAFADHSWRQFRSTMPLRNGKFLDEDSCREKWLRTPATWNQWLAAVKNYAASEEVKAGAVCSPMTFLSRKWRDFMTPEEPLGHSPPYVPDLSWKAEAEQDERALVEFERKAASGEIRTRPRDRLPFESETTYQEKLAAGNIPKVQVMDG